MKYKYFASKFKDENGIKWDSKKEYNRYLELKECNEIKQITNLQRQISFELIPKHKTAFDTRCERSIDYVCDFLYILNGVLVVEDVKSDFTRKDKYYILKRKMLKYIYFNSEDKEFKKLHDKFPELSFQSAVFNEEIE